MLQITQHFSGVAQAIQLSSLIQPTVLMSIEELRQPAQILCIEDQEAVLFSELIQVSQDQSKLWVRPLAIAYSEIHAETIPFPTDYSSNTLALRQGYDLRQSVDLLLPVELFRPALDSEFLPLLSLWSEDPQQTSGESLQWLCNENAAQEKLRRFVRNVWDAYTAAQNLKRLPQ